MKMDAVCYGFRSFGQLDKDPFLPINFQLKSFHNNKTVTIKYITFAWSKCYVFLCDNSLIVQGYVDSNMAIKKRIQVPFEEELKRILCLKDCDLFLTKQGHCWKYSKDGNWFLVTHLWKCNDGKIIDVVSNGDELRFVLFNTGVLYSLYTTSTILSEIKVRKVSCGFEHNICVSDSGSVYVWGCNSRGQLGNGSLLSVEHPELLELLDGLFVFDIDAAGWHSAAITTCGALYTWGWNNFGQLGFMSDQNTEIGDNTYISVLPEPRLVDWPDSLEVDAKQVACGSTHTIVLADDGVVWGCGNNKYGQVSPLVSKKLLDVMTRVPVPENSVIKRISCTGWNTTLYVSNISLC